MVQGFTRRAVLAGGAVWLGGCGGRIYDAGRPPPPGRVLIFPPHITLGERRLGGAFRLRRDWSEPVRLAVLDAAAKAVARRRRAPVFLTAKDDADAAWALARLHRPVAESLMDFDDALTGGRRPPTRRRPGLGPGARPLAAAHEAGAGLFISVTGGYAEGWQRAAEIVLAETMAVRVDGVARRVIVSLVELETGQVFWSGARRDRAIRDPLRAAGHVDALTMGAAFRRPQAA